MADDTIALKITGDDDGSLREALDVAEAEAKSAAVNIAAGFVDAGQSAEELGVEIQKGATRGTDALESLEIEARRVASELDKIDRSKIDEGAEAAERLARDYETAARRAADLAELSEQTAVAVRHLVEAQERRANGNVFDPEEVKQLGVEFERLAAKAREVGDVELADKLDAELAKVKAAINADAAAFDDLDTALAKTTARVEAFGASIEEGRTRGLERQALAASIGLERLREKIAKLQAQGRPVPQSYLDSLDKLEQKEREATAAAGKLAAEQDEIDDKFKKSQRAAGFLEGGIGSLTDMIDQEGIPGFANFAAAAGLLAAALFGGYQAGVKLREVGQFIAEEITGRKESFDEAVVSVSRLGEELDSYVLLMRGVRGANETLVNDADRAKNAAHALGAELQETGNSQARLTAETARLELAMDNLAKGQGSPSELATAYARLERANRGLEGAMASGSLTAEEAEKRFDSLSNALRRQALELGAEADAFRRLRGNLQGIDSGSLEKAIKDIDLVVKGLERSRRPLTDLGEDLPGFADQLAKVTADAARLGEQVPASFNASVNGVLAAGQRLKRGDGSAEDLRAAFAALEADINSTGGRLEKVGKAQLPEIGRAIEALAAGGKGTSVRGLSEALRALRDSSLAVEGQLAAGTIKRLEELKAAVGDSSRTFAELGVSAPAALQATIDAVLAYSRVERDLSPERAKLLADQIAALRAQWERLPESARESLAPQIAALDAVLSKAAAAGAEVRDIFGRQTAESIAGSVERLKGLAAELGGLSGQSAQFAQRFGGDLVKVRTALAELSPAARQGLGQTAAELGALINQAAAAGAQFEDDFGRKIPASIASSLDSVKRFAAASGGLKGIWADTADEVVKRAKSILDAINSYGPAQRKELAGLKQAAEEMVRQYGALGEAGREAAKKELEAAKVATAALKERIATVRQSVKETLAAVDEFVARAASIVIKPPTRQQTEDPAAIAAELAGLQRKVQLTTEEQARLQSLGQTYRDIAGDAQIARQAQDAAKASALEQVGAVTEFANRIKETTAGIADAAPAQKQAIDTVIKATTDNLASLAQAGKLSQSALDEGTTRIRQAIDGVGAGGRDVTAVLDQIAASAAGIGPPIKKASEELPEFVKKLEEQLKAQEDLVRRLSKPAEEFGRAVADVAQGTKGLVDATTDLETAGRRTEQSFDTSTRSVERLVDGATKLGEGIPALSSSLEKFGDAGATTAEKVDILTPSMGLLLAELERIPALVESMAAIAKSLADIGKAHADIGRMRTELEALIKAVAKLSEDREKIASLGEAVRGLAKDAHDALTEMSALKAGDTIAGDTP